MAQAGEQDPAVALVLKSGKASPEQVKEAEELVSKMKSLGVERDVLGALVDRKVITPGQAEAFREAGAKAGKGGKAGRAAKAADAGRPVSERIKIAATNDADPAAAQEALESDESRPTCANHPAALAVNDCSYCRKPICKDCVIRTEKGYYCSEECMAGAKSGKPAKALTGVEGQLDKAAQLGRKLSIVGAVIVLIAIAWIVKYVVDDYRFSSAMRAGTNPGVQSEKAVDHFRRAAELRPDSAEARHLLGKTFMQLGEIGAAVAELEMASKLAEKNGEIVRDLATAHEKKGNYAEAKAALMKLRDLGVADSNSETSLGTICQDQLNEMDIAVDAFTRAITVSSETREIRYRIGVALMALGKFKEAREQFAMAVKPVPPGLKDKAASREKVFLSNGPKIAAVHAALAELAQKEGDLSSALASIALAQKTQPGKFEIVLARAKLLEEAGQKDEILPALMEAHDSLLGNPEYLDMLAGVQEEQCAGDEALRTLRRLHHLKPEMEGVVERLIKAEAEQGSAREAHALLKSLGEEQVRNKEFVPVWIAIIKQELARNQPKEAEKMLLALKDVAESDQRFAGLWCDVLHRQGRDKEALEVAEVAVRKNPRSAMPHIIIGSVLRSVGRTRDALKHIRKAAELGAGGTAEMEIGMVMWEVGLNDEAKKHFVAALDTPDLPPASRRLIQRHLGRMSGSDLGLTRYSEPMEFIDGQLVEASTEPGNLLRQIHLASCGIARAFALIAGSVGLDPVGDEIEQLRLIDYTDEELRKATVFAKIRAEYDRAVKNCGEAVGGLLTPSAARAVDAELAQYGRASTNAISVLDQVAAAGIAQANIIKIWLDNHDRKARVGIQASTIMERMHARVRGSPGAFQQAIAADCALAELGEVAIAGLPQAPAFRASTAAAMSKFANTIDTAPDPLAQLCMSRMVAFKIMRILCRQVLEAGSAMGPYEDDSKFVASLDQGVGGAE